MRRKAPKVGACSHISPLTPSRMHGKETGLHTGSSVKGAVGCCEHAAGFEPKEGSLAEESVAGVLRDVENIQLFLAMSSGFQHPPNTRQLTFQLPWLQHSPKSLT